MGTITSHFHGKHSVTFGRPAQWLTKFANQIITHQQQKAEVLTLPYMARYSEHELGEIGFDRKDIQKIKAAGRIAARKGLPYKL